MKLKFTILLNLMCAMIYCAPSFANGRAKWLVDTQKTEQVSGGCVIKEVKSPPAVSARWFDYDNQGEVPRGSVGKSLGLAIQYNQVWLGILSDKIKLPSGLLRIYSFRFIRLLLFPHHAFD